MIENVITCGVRWGSNNSSFADEILFENNISVLYKYHKNAEYFKNAKTTDIVALKDGYQIIALGRFQSYSETTWQNVLKNNLKGKSQNHHNFSEAYDFDLDEEVLLIKVDEWIKLNPPIYYPNRQSTVIIQQDHIKKECINRFNTNDVLDKHQYILSHTDFYLGEVKESLDQVKKIENSAEKYQLFSKALEYVEIVLKFDNDNSEALTLKNIIITHPEYILQKNMIVANRFQKKADRLSCANYFYILLFISTVLALVYLLINKIEFNINTSSNLLLSIASYITKVSTIIASIFWIAKFFNRRIHENVHLIEEYEFRALLFNSCQDIGQLYPHYQDTYLKKIIDVACTNIDFINTKKADKIPIELLDILNIIKKTDK